MNKLIIGIVLGIPLGFVLALLHARTTMVEIPMPVCDRVHVEDVSIADDPLAIVTRYYAPPVGFPTNTPPSGWKDYLSTRGVTWPEGSSVAIFPDLPKYAMANTPQNHRVFTAVLADLCSRTNKSDFWTETETDSKNSR